MAYLFEINNLVKLGHHNNNKKKKQLQTLVILFFSVKCQLHHQVSPSAPTKQGHLSLKIYLSPLIPPRPFEPVNMSAAEQQSIAWLHHL